MSRPAVVRRAVRLLILDEARRLLLLHYLTPDTGEEFWCTPGGARDGEESDLETARREGREELGFALDEVGSCVATRTHCFRIGDGRVFQQHERFYLIRTPGFEPESAELSEFERKAVQGHRWWPLDELRRAEIPVTPARLADLVTRLLDGVTLAVPVDLDAWTDSPSVPPVGIEPTSTG